MSERRWGPRSIVINVIDVVADPRIHLVVKGIRTNLIHLHAKTNVTPQCGPLDPSISEVIVN